MSSLRLITAGESHGPGLTCIVEGLPAGLELELELLDRDMARRQLGHGRGGRMKIERDRIDVTAGVRHGRTLGGPIALQVANRDYANWEERMNPWPVEAEIPEVHLPRPGHADLVGTQKFRLSDVRNVLERASARETAARVAGGTLAKALLRAVGVEVRSHVTQIGPVLAPARDEPLSLDDFDGVDDDPVRCLDPAASEAMVAHITAQRKANESIGGTWEVVVFGLVPGLGSHVSWEERLDGRLAGAVCSIQACKGVEFGDGFRLAAAPGSQAHDEIFHDEARLLPHHESRRRPRGRDDDGRPARRPRGDEADPDAHEAAAVRGHRHPRAGAGAARAHRLVRRARRGGRGGGDGRLRARRRVPAQVRWRPHRRRDRGRGPLPGAHRVAGAVVLVGFMGAGKTSAARTLDPAALDTDAEIERRAGCAIPELFAQRGEVEFRALEEQVALELLDRAQPGTPVALGGGTLGSERVRRALEDHVVAYLEIDEDTAWARATADGITRPLAADRERFATLLRERRPVYEAAADAFLSAGRDPRGRAGAACPAARAPR